MDLSYGAENELIVAALDSATMVTAAGSIARPMKIAENGIEIAAINSARPTAALAYDGQMYIGATESGDADRPVPETLTMLHLAFSCVARASLFVVETRSFSTLLTVGGSWRLLKPL